MALNDRQRAFCQEYVVDRNATQAYIRAGYSPGGARQSAAKLLANADVRALIDALEQALAKRAELSADWVLTRVQRLADAEVDEVPASVVLRALELAGKHVGMWPQGQVQDEGEGTETLVERLERLAGE